MDANGHPGRVPGAPARTSRTARPTAPAALLAAAIALVPILAAHAPAAAQTRFFPVEIHIDAGAAPLAAWQVELTYPAPRIAIVGIEGGDAPFAEAPYHDPRGLESGRVVVASFTLDPSPPRGRVRVARIHLADRGGPGAPDVPVGARLVVAADPDGNPIPARVEISHGQGGDR